MQRISWTRTAKIVGIGMLLLALPILAACGGGEEEPTPTPTPTTPAEVSEFDVVQEAVANYLVDRAAGTNGGNILATDLYGLINDGDPDTTPYIASIRSAADYAKGHIPGAVNIAFGDLTTLPEDEDIVIYCYTGQSGSMATALLGTMGYNVQNLRNGMSSWTTDADVYVSRFDPATDQNTYPTETTANPATGGNDYPEIDNTTSNDDDEIIAAAVETVTAKYITASNLYALLNDGDSDNDPFILSIRSADDYAAGHIAGAVNIALNDLADNLDKLPPDETIVVYCYTGHTAGQATALLNMLGYDAQSLKFGFCSWSDTATHCFNADTDTNDYDYVTGTSPE